MGEWEEQRRKSWGYYLCLLLFFWPVLLIPIQFLFAPYSLTFESLGMSFAFAIFITGLAIGCGTKYRHRGINPRSRIILTSTDEHYD